MNFISQGLRLTLYKLILHLFLSIFTAEPTGKMGKITNTKEQGKLYSLKAGNPREGHKEQFGILYPKMGITRQEFTSKEAVTMRPMSQFTTDFQHSGMIAKDLDETIDFYTQKLGFELVGIFPNGENRCAFLRLGHLTIETWEGEEAPMATGAINHWALDTPDIEAAFHQARELGLTIKEASIQSIPTFWNHGIRYFNIVGPNRETIEFCQIL